MKLERLTPMLLANDMTETMAFYTDVLGFEVTGTMGDPIGWFAAKKDDVHLMFVWNEPHEHEPGEDHDHSPALTGVLYFNPADVDAMYADVSTKWTICEELADHPHGMREFAVLDPNGYRLRFGVSLE